jgi:hypothetical protein
VDGLACVPMTMRQNKFGWQLNAFGQKPLTLTDPAGVGETPPDGR